MRSFCRAETCYNCYCCMRATWTVFVQKFWVAVSYLKWFIIEQYTLGITSSSASNEDFDTIAYFASRAQEHAPVDDDGLFVSYEWSNRG